jgi:hypothetical protein
MSKTSISDSASRISSLKTELSAMDKAFREELGKLQSQALAQAESQLLHGSMLNGLAFSWALFQLRNVKL